LKLNKHIGCRALFRRRIPNAENQPEVFHIPFRNFFMVNIHYLGTFPQGFIDFAREAVAALRNAGVGRIVVAVPTAHRHSAEMIARDVEALYCANIRGGLSYAVASAYQYWSDVAEEDVVKILEQFKTRDL